jgi:hypothetical protein
VTPCRRIEARIPVAESPAHGAGADAAGGADRPVEAALGDLLTTEPTPPTVTPSSPACGATCAPAAGPGGAGETLGHHQRTVDEPGAAAVEAPSARAAGATPVHERLEGKLACHATRPTRRRRRCPLPSSVPGTRATCNDLAALGPSGPLPYDDTVIEIMTNPDGAVSSARQPPPAWLDPSTVEHILRLVEDPVSAASAASAPSVSAVLPGTARFRALCASGDPASFIQKKAMRCSR